MINLNSPGETTCVSGSTCVKTNDYYSQCIPGANTQPTSGPSSTSTSKTTSVPSTTGPTSSSPSSTPAAGNPFSGKSVYVSPYYAAEVNAAAATLSDSAMKAKYAKVAQIPTFIWLDVIAKVPDLATYLADAKSKNQILPIVVYDLPDRDCAAKASNGEFSIANGGEANYKKYIDAIVAQIKGVCKIHYSSSYILSPNYYQRIPLSPLLPLSSLTRLPTSSPT